MRTRVFPLLISILLPAAALAQPVVEVPSAPECPRCRIVFTRVATLGGADDPVSPMAHVARVERDSRGRFYVAPVVGGAQVLVYGADGRFEKTIGRAGEGPGEYGYAVEARVGPGDSLYVADVALHRVTVLAPDHTVARTARLKHEARTFVPRGGGELLMHAWDRTPENAGNLLFRLGPEGEVRRAFAASGVRPDRIYELHRMIAMSRDGSVWAARFNEYRIEKWDPRTGRLLRTLVRRPEWFAPWTSLPRGYPDLTRPVTWLEGVREDEEGRLWVFLRVADADWKAGRAARTSASGNERGMVLPSALHRYVDTIVEVIDPVRGRVIASGRFGRYYSALLINGRGDVYSSREISDGLEVLDIWKTDLIQP